MKVSVSHPEKLLFPADAITKGEFAAYHEMIAPLMLPYLRGRPVTMERYPQGIDNDGFMQKDVSKGFPAWLQRVEVPKRNGVVHHPVVTDLDGIMWLANQNCITAHVWTSRAPNVYQPDVCVFDLDPSIDDDGMLIGAALQVGEVLDELGLTSWVKTSGSKGFHVVVCLDATAPQDKIAAFAHQVAAVLVHRDPARFTQEFTKADRGDRILIDTGRNGYSATHATAYAVRPIAGAPVSAPCTWDEIARGEVAPQSFSLRSMFDRVEVVGDLWADMYTHSESLDHAMRSLQRIAP